MAQAKLSRNSQSRVNAIMERLQATSLGIAQIKEGQIEEIVRRDAIPFEPDGYSSDSMPEHTSGGSFSSRTETVALQSIARREDGKQRHKHNELRRVLKHIEKLVMHADVAINELQNTLAYAREVDEKIKGPRQTSPCTICLVLPAEVSGYCRKDYDTWRNYGQPDRQAWEMFKNRTTITEGHNVILMVPQCPPPTVPARRGPYAENKVA